MGDAGLNKAFEKGVPLVDVTVLFVEGVDYPAATARLNALADDFDLNPEPFYDDPRSRIGTATKESLERLFGWQLKRTPLERFDEKTGTWGH